MNRKILLGSLGFLALAAPAMAQEPCAAPALPAIPDGARATQAQIVAAQNAIKIFAAASDGYQACLAREIEHQKELAKQLTTDIDPAVQAALETKATAQRKDVERLAAAWGTSVKAFTAAQQQRQRQNPPTVPPAMRGTMGMGGGYGGNPY